MTTRRDGARWALLAGLAALLLAGRAPAQSLFDQIGYTDLRARLGNATPTGANVFVAQIEAQVAANTYLPDPSAFPGKTITDQSGGGQISGHATTVGQYFYGDPAAGQGGQSIAPGITQIDAYRIDGSLTSGDWLGDTYLRLGQSLPPRSIPYRVQNHSYIDPGDPNNPGPYIEILRRIDLVVRRDNTVIVVAVNNGAGPVPALEASGYNSIAVGLSNGGSSTGPTTAPWDGAGRSKPDIVVPLGLTSFATPVVSAASALLVQTAAQNPDPVQAADAGHVETIKAALLSGATKTGLAGAWHRNDNGQFVEPLDRQFGAGQLNINNSQLILGGAEQRGSNTTRVTPTGWAYETLTGVGDHRRYYFDVPTGGASARLAATVNWLRRVTQVPGTSTFNATLSTLELRLYTTDANLNLGPLVDSSLSPIDNVQHVYDEVSLGGHYALDVNLASLPSGQLSEDYGIAWQTIVAVPEPGGWALVGVMTVGFAAVRRRVSAGQS